MWNKRLDSEKQIFITHMCVDSVKNVKVWVVFYSKSINVSNLKKKIRKIMMKKYFRKIIKSRDQGDFLIKIYLQRNNHIFSIF